VVARYDPVLVNEEKHVRLTQLTPAGLMEAEETYQEILAH